MLMCRFRRHTLHMKHRWGCVACQYVPMRSVVEELCGRDETVGEVIGSRCLGRTSAAQVDSTGNNGLV